MAGHFAESSGRSALTAVRDENESWGMGRGEVLGSLGYLLDSSVTWILNCSGIAVC